MLLSKLMVCRTSCNVQIVAMSATMTGLDSLSTWLHAHLFLTNFRPVPLTEHAVFGGVVYAKVDRPDGEHSTTTSSGGLQEPATAAATA
jgi:replicative superfamily II helicase